jgi:hypothetical protein
VNFLFGFSVRIDDAKKEKEKRNWSVISFRVFHAKIIRLFHSRQLSFPPKNSFGRSPFNSYSSCKSGQVQSNPVADRLRLYLLFYFILFFALGYCRESFVIFTVFLFLKSRVTSCAVFFYFFFRSWSP